MEVQLPATEIWLKDILKYYLENTNGKWIIVKAIRQCGKSVLAQILLIAASLKEPKSVSYSISPVMSLSRKMFEDICRIADQLISKSNGSLLTITFINGSKIFFKSAEQGDSIRGETCKKSGIVVIDEAAYIDSDFFYSVVTPFTNVFNSDIFLFSTPKFKQGMFYDLFIDGMTEKGKCKSFDWTEYDTSKYLSSETLEIYRKQLPRAAFNSEYLGMWIDGDGTVFSDFKKCIGEAVLDKSKRLTIGIDWASGSGGDDTVIVSGQVNDNKVQIKDAVSFNDKNANETIDFIVDYVKSYVQLGFNEIHLVVEKNSIGNVFGDILRQKLGEYEDEYNDIDWRKQISITTQYFITSNTSKEKIIKQLCVLFENQNIVIPDNAKLINQLSIYEVKISSAGNCIYNAPNRSGAHDDYVMATAILTGNLYAELTL